MRWECADSIRARGLIEPHQKAGYMGAIFFLSPTNLSCNTGRTIYATFGLTYRPNDHSEWNLAYMHALDERVNTNTTAFGIPGSIKMYQNAVEIGYSWQF